MAQHNHTRKPTPDALRLAREAEVLRPNIAAPYLGISRRKLYQLSELDPEFPRKIVYSARCVGWRREALDEWLRTREVEAV